MGNNIESRVCELISLISTSARDYVQDAFNKQTVTLVHYENSQHHQGAFCVVEKEDCTIAYAAFPRYNHDGFLLKLMSNSLRRHLARSETKEVCFNVYGRNEEIVQLAKELGFATDMEGFQLQYDFSKGCRMPDMRPLVERGFSSGMLDQFIQLFDKAYYHVNVENGWNTGTPSKDHFLHAMLNYESEDRVRSFWNEDRLIGAYIISGEYIRDFVVHPEYQNCGYGSRMLENCVYRMVNTMGVKNIFLRVAKSNVGAKRFYERNNFTEVSCFAEHTFVPKSW